jgi:hypothetical protein
MNKFAKEPGKLPIWDINLATYERYHNIPVELHNIEGSITFEFHATEQAYRLMELYQENRPVKVLDRVSVLRALRGRIVGQRGPRKQRSQKGDQ